MYRGGSRLTGGIDEVTVHVVRHHWVGQLTEEELDDAAQQVHICLADISLLRICTTL